MIKKIYAFTDESEPEYTANLLCEIEFDNECKISIETIRNTITDCNYVNLRENEVKELIKDLQDILKKIKEANNE